MTTTPEERSLRVLGEIEAYTVDDLAWPQWSDLIAQAIREAEDAALERAIACVSDNFVNGEGHYAIEAIRSLKHNKG